MPTKPSPLPTTTVIRNLTLRPESVILCTMLTSMTSSLRSGRRMSTISGLTQRELRGEGLAHGGDLSVEDHLAQSCLWNPFHLSSPPCGSLLLNQSFPHPRRCAAPFSLSLDGQHVLAMGDIDACVDHALQGGEDRRALGRLLEADVQHGIRSMPFFFALLPAR